MDFQPCLTFINITSCPRRWPHNTFDSWVTVLAAFLRVTVYSTTVIWCVLKIRLSSIDIIHAFRTNWKRKINISTVTNHQIHYLTDFPFKFKPNIFVIYFIFTFFVYLFSMDFFKFKSFPFIQSGLINVLYLYKLMFAYFDKDFAIYLFVKTQTISNPPKSCIVRLYIWLFNW